MLPNQLNEGKILSGTDGQHSKMNNQGAGESNILSDQLPSANLANQDESNNFNFEELHSKEESDKSSERKSEQKNFQIGLDIGKNLESSKKT